MEQSCNPDAGSFYDRIDQIGVVVHNVDECVAYYEKILGEGSFVTVEGEEPAVLGDGSEINIKGKLALAQMGSIQMELIEIKDGPSIHVDFLKSQGEGIHHVGMYTDHFDADIERFRKLGIGVLQQGKGMIRYAYMDTKPVILELIENQ